jgi:hypothetical protein
MPGTATVACWDLKDRPCLPDLPRQPTQVLPPPTPPPRTANAPGGAGAAAVQSPQDFGNIVCPQQIHITLTVVRSYAILS